MIKIITLLFILGFSQATANKSWPTGAARPTTYNDLKDHPSKSKTYNEVWTYHFIFDNKMQINLNYTRANLGSFKDPVTGADISVNNFKGKNYSVAREYPERKFKFTDSKQQLNVHEKIWFEGKLPETHRVRFETAKKGVSYLVDLNFSDIEPGICWGNGIFKIGEQEIGIFIHIPRAKVTGTVTINNQKVEVTGIAYMDHTFQTVMGSDLVRAGYRYYATEGDINMGYFVQPLAKHKIPWIGYGFKKRGDKMELVKPVSVEIISSKKKAKIDVPAKIKISLNGSNIMVQRDKDIQQMSILDGVDGYWAKKAVKMFLGGEIIYFRGIGKVDGKPAVTNFFGLR